MFINNVYNKYIKRINKTIDEGKPFKQNSKINKLNRFSNKSA